MHPTQTHMGATDFQTQRTALIATEQRCETLPKQLRLGFGHLSEALAKEANTGGKAHVVGRERDIQPRSTRLAGATS